jgi:hypothetical protein
VHSSSRSARSRLRRKLQIAVVALAVAVATLTVLIVLQFFGGSKTSGAGPFELHAGSSGPALGSTVLGSTVLGSTVLGSTQGRPGQSADRRGLLAGEWAPADPQ